MISEASLSVHFIHTAVFHHHTYETAKSTHSLNEYSIWRRVLCEIILLLSACCSFVTTTMLCMSFSRCFLLVADNVKRLDIFHANASFPPSMVIHDSSCRLTAKLMRLGYAIGRQQQWHRYHYSAEDALKKQELHQWHKMVTVNNSLLDFFYKRVVYSLFPFSFFEKRR